MKKLLVALLMILFANMANAENYVIFKSDVVETAINQLVSSENRQAAADEYQKNMDPETGKISVLGLYKVCIAAGFNIQSNDGYSLCRNFLNFMITETENMGIGISSQQNCANQFNGVWTLSSDGTTYQCVGRDGYELVYAGACSGENGECIKQFASLQTQGSNGREFINAYGKLHGLNLTCHSVTETRRSVANPLGQDYIKCSAGGRAYEFEFDDLNQTPGDKSSHSENTAICELYGGKIVDTGDKNTESIWQSCDISSELCNGAVADLAMRTGHTVQYQGYCRLSRKAKVVSVVDLHQIDGIDSRIFYNAGAQMRMDTAKPMVEEYLRTKFPNETYIVCDTNPRELNQGLGVDIDYVMSCTVGAQRVDFVFDDLSESFDSDAATGMDIMQCIINGGTFNGETCRGLTESECDALDAKLRASGSENGAYYDDDMRACVLGNAMATYQRNVVAGYVVGAVVIVGGTVLTIASGGAAAPVVINGVAMLATDIGINYAIDANHRRLSEKAAQKFVDFVTDADACTTEQCALEVLEKHYATLSGVMSDLNTDDQAVVDETMDRLIGLIQTEFVACGENESGQTVYASPADCAMQQSKLTLLDHIDPYSEIALVIGSVIYDPGYVVTRFTRLKNVTKTITETTGAMKFLANSMADNIGKSLRTFDDINTQRIVLQSNAEGLKQFLAEQVDLIEYAPNIDDATVYANGVAQRVSDLKSWADEQLSAVEKLLKDDSINEANKQLLEVYANDISDVTRQVQEIADKANATLEARTQSLIAARIDVEYGLVKQDARRTNTREYITEPVMYFRAIPKTDKSPEEIVQILNDAGIRASTDVSDQSAWVINKAVASRDYETGYELVSPFLSPENAAKEFDIVNDILEQNGIITFGAVTPTTIQQIDPTSVTGVSIAQARSNIRKYFENDKELQDLVIENGLSLDAATDEELLDILIFNKLDPDGKNLYSINRLSKQYEGDDVLYRGQKFATSDPSSAYANMAPKAGATGSVLGTPNLYYAAEYTGGNGTGVGLSGKNIGEIKVGNNNVGFLNVYNNNERNTFYGNYGIEYLSDINRDKILQPKYQNMTKKLYDSETLITPQDNPIVDRYITTDCKFFTKLDENDGVHKLIMDAMAPDLSKTYNSEMLQRIENVENEMTNGMVQTYDLPPDVINTLGG